MTVPPIPAPPDCFALTPVQAGMVYDAQAGLDPSVNLEQVVVHLPDEPLNVAAMQAAWDDAISRHPALRLMVHQDAEGGLTQSVATPFAAPLRLEDHEGAHDPQTALTAFLAQDRARGIDLARAANWRLHWLRFGPRHSVLVWTFSHVMLDGRSFARILEEVFATYDGQYAELPVLPAFRDHCAALAAIDHTDAKAYFQGYLGEFDRATPLGFQHPASSHPANQTLEAHLDAAQSQALARRAETAQASFATMVQAAWGLVLARVAGVPEAVFGVTRSGRFLTPFSRDAVGCLITTQPLRIAIAPDMTLNALLAQIRAAQLEQRPYEHLGLTEIAGLSTVPSGRPLFDSLVMVERQSLHERMRALGGVWSQRRVELFETGAMPMTLGAYGDAELLLRLEFAPQSIAAPDAARYLDYMQRLLVAMAAAAPEAKLSELAMLPAAETAALTALGLPEHPLTGAPSCIADGFEAIARAQPNAIAVAQAGQARHWSYAKLGTRANQLAHDMIARGIRPGDRIGLCLPRGPMFVALLLAAAKVGAAFVPMDPSYPDESLAQMADDSAVTLIYAQLATGWLTGRAVVLTNDDLARDAPTTPPDRSDQHPDLAAYVIYTSGTSGKPKGVVISQRGFAAYAAAAITSYRLSPADRALQFAALSFDVALEEMVPTLLAGATLVLRDDAMIASPQAFAQGVAAAGITVLNLPTGFWQVLLAAMAADTAKLPATLRLMVVGGERMPPDALARWLALPAVPRLINAYGPTEATITSACFTADAPVTGAEVPVGRAMGHAYCRLLAPDGSLAPMGAVAELWLGGQAVAMGYLNQNTLTAQRFQPDRIIQGGRLYRSGDLARWNDGGQLVVQGRNDRQIKLRGYRIEPAEVEALLETFPAVAQAHVGLLAQGATGARLIGWLRPSQQDAPPDLPAMRRALAELLPEPKRPELVVVGNWPQTPGGKIDVKRLPRPEQRNRIDATPAPGDSRTAPIIAVFAKVLGRDVPGPDASFFDLGGHSLMLLTLIGHLETVFSRRLTVAQVHAHPTPRSLADLMDRPLSHAPRTGSNTGLNADLADCVMPIQPMGDAVPIYGVHVLGVNGSFFRPLAQAMGRNQPIFGLTVGLLSADTPTTVGDTAELYFRVIEKHRPQGPVALVAVSLGSYIALELAQRLIAAGREVRFFAVMDAEGPTGRDKIRGWHWARAHLALLRQGGLEYLRRFAGTKWANQKHRLAKLRLSLRDRFLRAGPVVNSVEGFVAANEAAIRNYQPAPFPGRITVIRARASVFDSDKAIEDGLGWADVAQGGLEVIDVEGDHLSILDRPGVLQVARAFTRLLTRV